MAQIPNQYFDGWKTSAVIVVAVASISWYNSLELLLMVTTKFKTWKSLLFISLMVSSFGVIPYFVGFLIEYFAVGPFWLAMLLSTVGWIALITGSSVVLYSRLGLIVSNQSILKFVKWMIITTATIFHISVTVVQYGQTYSDRREAFHRGLFYLEKIQMTGFCIQEFIISGIYLWQTLKLLKVIRKKGIRKVMIELFLINCFIVVGDIALLVLEYSGERTMERTWKGFVYSVKLKLEFAILSKLIDLVQASQRTLSNALANVDSFVDMSRTNSAATQPLANAGGSASDGAMPRWMLKLEQRNVQTLHVEDITTINDDSDPFITKAKV